MTAKFYVKRAAVTNSDFWRYNTHKQYTSVEDYFELDSYESLWGLFYYLNGNDLTFYNEMFDRYTDEHFPGKDYDDCVDLLTEEDYKAIVELCNGEYRYITIDFEEEIEFAKNLRPEIGNNKLFLEHFNSLTKEQQEELITAATLSTGNVATWDEYAINEVVVGNAEELTVIRY
ncbi:hypothetical protein [Streptococcus suis]|uniref:hypothetical protein n=1 Tax=Streptococcus suis TaxID=1307 RepID=UPI0038BA4384